MYLIDTDVISEARKGDRANVAMSNCLHSLAQFADRHRRDEPQAKRLERWLHTLSTDFGASILPFDQEAAHVWGRLRVPHAENPLDKQIVATALIHDLIVVTRNVAHYQATGVRTLNPFT